MKRASVQKKYCVACGCCRKVCPKGAISIYKGKFAQISADCVGCGKCAVECPASTIQLAEAADLDTDSDKEGR